MKSEFLDKLYTIRNAEQPMSRQEAEVLIQELNTLTIQHKFVAAKVLVDNISSNRWYQAHAALIATICRELNPDVNLIREVIKFRTELQKDQELVKTWTRKIADAIESRDCEFLLNLSNPLVDN